MPGLPPMTVPAMRGSLGGESDPWAFIGHLVLTFRELRRALRDDGTLWLNLGDSYHNLRTHNNGGAPTNTVHRGGARDGTESFARTNRNHKIAGVKDKDLLGIPWRVAFALQADGWFLRMDNVWSKPNPMPESVKDRPTRAHEYVFLLSKSARYFYNPSAVAETTNDGARNRRSVWRVSTHSYTGAHFATMPPALAELAILASTPSGESAVVLDPFGGAGTTAMVARRLGRSFVHVELNATYMDLARRRFESDAPLFNRVSL